MKPLAHLSLCLESPVRSKHEPATCGSKPAPVAGDQTNLLFSALPLSGGTLGFASRFGRRPFFLSTPRALGGFLDGPQANMDWIRHVLAACMHSHHELHHEHNAKLSCILGTHDVIVQCDIQLRTRCVKLLQLRLKVPGIEHACIYIAESSG